MMCELETSIDCDGRGTENVLIDNIDTHACTACIDALTAD